MQVQKDDGPAPTCDISDRKCRLTQMNMAKSGQKAMHGAHCGHARPPIASHLQHDYLAVIEGDRAPSN